MWNIVINYIIANYVYAFQEILRIPKNIYSKSNSPSIALQATTLCKNCYKLWQDWYYFFIPCEKVRIANFFGNLSRTQVFGVPSQENKPLWRAGCNKYSNLKRLAHNRVRVLITEENLFHFQIFRCLIIEKET